VTNFQALVKQILVQGSCISIHQFLIKKNII